MNEMKEVASVRIVGPNRVENRAPVVSLDFHDQDNAEIAFLLESEYGIATRTGLHCAPSIHQALSTLHTGACRASVGIYNTEEDIDRFCEAVQKVLER